MRRRRRVFIPIVAGLLSALLMAVLTLPVFNIEDITVRGNSAVSSSDIEKALSARGINIFAFFAPSAVGRIMDNPYVESAAVTKVYPGSLIVDISERIPRAYVKVGNMETFLLIDDKGMVLDTSGFPKDGLPVIVGLKFPGFAVGSFLETDGAAFDSIVKIDSLLKSNNLTDSLEIEMTDEDDIHLYINGVDVEFGTLSDANEKILTAVECLKKLPSGAKGFLDVKSSSDRATFRFLK